MQNQLGNGEYLQFKNLQSLTFADNTPFFMKQNKRNHKKNCADWKFFPIDAFLLIFRIFIQKFLLLISLEFSRKSFLDGFRYAFFTEVFCGLFRHNAFDGQFPQSARIQIHCQFVGNDKRRKSDYQSLEIEVIFRHIFNVIEYESHHHF